MPAKHGVCLTSLNDVTTGAASGYDANIDPELVDLHILCLNGESCKLKLGGSCLGWMVHRMVSKQLQPKKGGKLILFHLESKLMLDKSLHEQGIVKAATLSCTFVPTDLYAAWRFVKGYKVPEGELEVYGITRIAGARSSRYLHHLPQSLVSLAVDDCFKDSLKRLTLPSGLQSLTFGNGFDQNLEQVTLPSTLQCLRFGYGFNRSLECVTLPSTLQSLKFGLRFNKSMERVTLPSTLQSLTFGLRFNKSWNACPFQALCRA